MSLQDVIHSIVLEKGPMLPAEIVREVNIRTGQTTDMFFAGAILSELMNAKLVKMSYAKIGGSRVYYCKGQEPKLVKLYDYLPEKYKRAYDILKKELVVRAKNLEPVLRVAMQDLKDFAVPLQVKLKEPETFFKWYLLPMDEVQEKIKAIMQQESQENENTIVPNTTQNKVVNSTSTSTQEQSLTEKTQNRNSKTLRQMTDDSEDFILPKPKATISQTKNQELKSVLKKSISNSQNQQTKSSSSFISESHSASKPQSQSQSKQKHSEMQFTLGASEEIQDRFVQKMLLFFQKNNIEIKHTKILKKESEAEFEGIINSQIGGIYYYFFAKSKKKLSEADLSYAYVLAQNKRLPLCYLSLGTLTKKAEELLKTELKSATFLKI